MNIDDSIVEDGALAMPMATLTPTLSRKERGMHETIRRLNPAIPEENGQLVNVTYKFDLRAG